MEHIAHTVFSEPAGKANDSWNRWREDLDLVQGMGLNAYRFSVEWSRIEPEQGVVDQSALDRYSQMIDGCLERGITPVVTLCHFTAPQWFACRGSWLNPDAASWFADECARVAGAVGDRVGAFLTFNEPNLPQILAWSGGDFDDGIQAMLAEAERVTGSDCYRLGNIVPKADQPGMIEGYAKAHRAAVAAVRAACGTAVPVGLSLSVTDDCAADEGGEAVVAHKRAECYEVWRDAVAGDDFIGIQNYEQCVYDANGIVPAPQGAPVNDAGTRLDPASLVHCAQYIHGLTGLPIFVTEHGIGTKNDERRCSFLEGSLACLASERGDVPVMGYLHWTLEDNFEWIFGYSNTFGLCSVDRTTLDRTPKPSADLYAKLVAGYRS